MSEHPCSARVSDGGRWASFHGCTRAGKVERDGRWWCAQHDPERVKAKRQAREDAYTAERDKRAAIALRAQSLADALGFGRPIYVPGIRASEVGGYAEGVFLTFDEAERLLAERRPR
jgi:hypothetical protein